MGKFTKWLGAGIGFSMGGPIGAILGFALGNMIDVFSKSDIQVDQQNKGYSDHAGKSGDFEIALLILSSIVIKSDGKIDQRELDYVRAYFVKMYGKERANKAFRLFKEIVKAKEVSTKQVCVQIRSYIDHSSRLQLLHYLFGIANADGQIHSKEMISLQKIANYLYINSRDFESIKSMFVDSADQAYKILEISKSASDAELKAAYRKMVKKYHPDKLASMGEEHKKGAQDKFIKVQQAYELISKERGL